MNSIRLHRYLVIVPIVLFGSLCSVCLGDELGGIVSSQSKIRISEKVVFDGLAGWHHGEMTYRLACAAIISEMPNGDLLCWWISGTDNEPAKDNCVLVSRSSDGGQTWSNPDVFVPVMDGMMTVASNIYPLEDGRVVALWAKLPVEGRYTQWHYYRMYSDDNGRTWSAPMALSVYDDDRASLFEGAPLKLASGQYLFAGTFFQKRKIPLAASISELVKAESEVQARAMPAGEGKTGGVFAEYLHGCISFLCDSQDAGDLAVQGTVDNRPLGLLEPTCVQLRNGTIVMLMRAQYGGYLWRTESMDGGGTWKAAWRTDIPNPSSMAHLVRLPDERIVLLHNPTDSGKREPLSIWISDDELKSWSVKEKILFGGKLAYPHGIVLKDGRFVFVYDHDRRQVRFVDVQLPKKRSD